MDKASLNVAYNNSAAVTERRNSLASVGPQHAAQIFPGISPRPALRNGWTQPHRLLWHWAWNALARFHSWRLLTEARQGNLPISCRPAQLLLAAARLKAVRWLPQLWAPCTASASHGDSTGRLSGGFWGA